MVELDFEKTPFTISKDGLKFYFSSAFNQKRFNFRVDDYIIQETLKLNNRYKVKANYSLILLISFYKKIEKRGFRIEFEDGKEFKNDSIIFATEF